MNNGKVISLLKSRGSLLKKVEIQIKMRDQCEVGTPKHSKLVRTIAKIDEKLAKLDEKIDLLQSTKVRPVCAYVTFDHEEGVLRAVEAFPESAIIRLCCTDDYKKFESNDGKRYSFKVQSAPEPTNVIWENLDIGAKERAIRQFITGTVTVIVLLLSFGFTIVAKLAVRVVK